MRIIGVSVAVLFICVVTAHAEDPEIKFDTGYPKNLGMLQTEWAGTFKAGDGNKLFAIQIIAILKTDLTVQAKDFVPDNVIKAPKWGPHTLGVGKKGTYLCQAVLSVENAKGQIVEAAKTAVVEVPVED